MVEYKKGYFARSIAGHDKGKLYIIIEGTEETGHDTFVFLCDGDLKPVDYPKKKKVKHIQVIKTKDPAIESKILAGQEIRNEDIKRAIKAYAKR